MKAVGEKEPRMVDAVGKGSGTRKRKRSAKAVNFFEAEFGVKEQAYPKFAQHFTYDATRMILKSDGLKHEFYVGQFDILSVAALREQLGDPSAHSTAGVMSFQHIVGEAYALHVNPANENAVFQVASQLNCLEMIHPKNKPEHGITIYQADCTQGPACARACPSGSVYRNYCVGGGQGGGNQVDCAQGLAELLDNHLPENQYWKVQNGYLMPTSKNKMEDLAKILSPDQPLAKNALGASRVGVHWSTDTALDVNGRSQKVTQVFCSAAPVSYTSKVSNTKNWEPLAQVLLDAAYDATLAVSAILARDRKTRVTVYLTLVGGGVFGNETEWIVMALQRALLRYQSASIDVKLVHFKTIPKEWLEVIPNSI
jgi:hypothetical protein